MMIVSFDYEIYKSMFNLGIETWVPRHKTWKKFQVSLLIGPIAVNLTVGSRSQFNKEKELLA